MENGNWNISLQFLQPPADAGAYTWACFSEVHKQDVQCCKRQRACCSRAGKTFVCNASLRLKRSGKPSNFNPMVHTTNM
eukprot:scaffold446602_cov38-Prasinocladus_malaysianus.AAC.1